MRTSLRTYQRACLRFAILLGAFAPVVAAQSLGGAGTIDGTVSDPLGAFVTKARVSIYNPVTGYQQSNTTDERGWFRFNNVPPNPYRLRVEASGFEIKEQEVSVRSAVPIGLKISLVVSGQNESVTVMGAGATLIENVPTAHSDIDRSQLTKLTTSDPGGNLSQAIIYGTGAVAGDANGFFHPSGDHAQISFDIDGYVISDQQSKIYSTQFPISAIQSMEVDTGTPTAEFGDKSSLIVQMTTRSGLGSNRVFGNLDATYGSFGTAGGSIGIGIGNAKVGNFLAIDGIRSGRFLDTPEFVTIHDKGNNESFFDRLDFQPTRIDAIHLDLFTARNWIQIPNSFDQLSQDQRQRVVTWSVAPGYQHTFGSQTLWTVNPFVRQDQFSYYGSHDVLLDQPSTQNQSRRLLNYGVKSDVGVSSKRQEIKFGADIKQTRLSERFGFGITDPSFNPVCVDTNGNAAGPNDLTDPNACAGLGLLANPSLQPGLVPYDLTRGGQLFSFAGKATITQYAVYGTDAITAGNFLFSLGLREDIYHGISSATGVQPRLGVSYHIRNTGTVLRAAYAWTFETPFNENLILSSATGTGGLAQNLFGADSIPIRPGRRNQFNAGFQQAIGRWMLLDADYFWKYTHNAFDFSTLLNTTIEFPIAWHKSKLDGVAGRLSTSNIHGFQAYWTFGHNRARYFPPEVGGLVPQGGSIGTGVFRVDHDQAFQSTVNLRYQRKSAEWIAGSWRYDSGLVVTGVPDVAAALTLTPAQQVAIGFSCGGIYATFTNPITTCTGVGKSTLLTLPQTGTENDDHNPDRVKPRHVFNIGIGSDNLFHTEHRERITAALDVSNLTNKVALYNFLSTFSGTHFVAPRSFTARVGIAF